jgi:hypothetical protein
MVAIVLLACGLVAACHVLAIAAAELGAVVLLALLWTETSVPMLIRLASFQKILEAF